MQRMKNIWLSLLPVILLQLPTLIEWFITYAARWSGYDLDGLDLNQYPELLTLLTMIVIISFFWKFPLFVWALLRVKRNDEDDDMPISQVIIYVLAYIAVGSMVSFASIFLIEQLQLTSYSWTVFYERADFGFIGSVLIAPVTEEVLFRDRVYHYAGKIFRNNKAALVYQALLFGVAHLNIYQGIHSFIMGLILGCCYKRTGSLKLCILLHGASNLCSLILLWSKVRYR